MSVVRVICVLFLVNFALTGCATITRGTTEAFVVQTDPSGADVRLSSGETCKSPCTLEKKRKDNFVVFISKPGYESTDVSVVSQVAGSGAAGMAGNVILGGIIGAGVDAASGATKELVPNPVEVKLGRVDEPEASLTKAERIDEAAAPDPAPEVTQTSRREMRDPEDETPTSPSQGDGDWLAITLEKKVHESIQGADYIWLDLRWTNTFEEETINKAVGELQIAQRGTERELVIPWTMELAIEPGQTQIEEESGFEVKETSSLAWLLRAKTKELEVAFVPERIVFSDGTEETF